MLVHHSNNVYILCEYNLAVGTPTFGGVDLGGRDHFSQVGLPAPRWWSDKAVRHAGVSMLQVLGSACLMLRMSQLAVYDADWLTPLDHLDDPPTDHDDDVTSPIHFRSRASKHNSVVG